MILTIDGQAHTGKSTAAARLAARYGFFLMNTGAMYRTTALKLLALGFQLTDEEPPPGAVEHHLADDFYELDEDRVILNGIRQDHETLYSKTSGEAASVFGEWLEVRLKLQSEQRRIAAHHANVVAEGRDQGSYVFQDAEFKFYLSASTAVQARRHALKMNWDYADDSAEFRELVEAFRKRNERDENRKHHPLCIPTGAHIIATDHLSAAEVFARMTEVVDPCYSPMV